MIKEFFTSYSDDFLEGMSLGGFIAVLQTCLADVIAAGYTGTEISLSEDTDGEISLRIGAHRKETPSEKAVREGQERIDAAFDKVERRQRYLELKKEFGGSDE